MSDYIKQILSSVQPLPPKLQKIGQSQVVWWEGKDGDAVIMAVGGTQRDEALAENLVEEELVKFGYKRALFHFAEEDPTDVLDREREGTDEDMSDSKQRDRTKRVQDNWNDLVAKAKRLIETGNVTIVTNEEDYVHGRVVGDHGNYETTITRKSQDGPTITGWHCTCPWEQFAYQRTRQWKIYEGRPCSHVLALYFLSKKAPIHTETMAPAQQGPPPPAGPASPFAFPPGQNPEATPGGAVPSVPEGPQGIRQLTPFKPEDVGANNPNELLEQRIPGLVQNLPDPRNDPLTEDDLARGLKMPEPRRKIQQPPLERLKEMQRLQDQVAEPGKSPYGSPAPPGTVSVPGARVPTPAHPFVMPGTYSTTKDIFVEDGVKSLRVTAGTKIQVIGSDEVMNVLEAEIDGSRIFVTADSLDI